MITVTLAYGTAPEKIEAVKRFLDETTLRNSDFNGVVFAVELGDYTQLDNQSPGVGVEDETTLFYKIQRILLGETPSIH